MSDLYIQIDPKEVPVAKMHSYLLGAVVPRPIAFASTVDEEGNVNLSPFSFFNVFSANPPIMIFSPSRKGRDNTTKHTYQNVKEIPEVVINIVSFDMVEQASLSSCEFPKGENEFIKAGFTAIPSQKVKPPRVGESPVSFECKVNQVIELGDGGGAGNLVICEVLLMHVKKEVLDDNGRIDPFKLDAVARMGQDFYCRIGGENVFVVPKPNEKVGIGFDRIPDAIRLSSVLTRNDLGRLGNIQSIPGPETLDAMGALPEVKEAQRNGIVAMHQLAQKFLREGKVEEAWKVLLLGC